jgi:hypothetical protein
MAVLTNYSTFLSLDLNFQFGKIYFLAKSNYLKYIKKKIGLKTVAAGASVLQRVNYYIIFYR